MINSLLSLPGGLLISRTLEGGIIGEGRLMREGGLINVLKILNS